MKKLPPFAIAVVLTATLPFIALAASGTRPPEAGTIGAEQARLLMPAPPPARVPAALPPALPAVMPPLPVAVVPRDNPSEPATLYFSNPELKLSPQERQALAIAKKWQAGHSTQGIKPVAGAHGTIRFLFGATQPSIVCAVLQVCDVELQPGERVNGIHLGDMVRWTVEPAVTGTGANEVQHLIIKPLDTGIETSLIVPTDRRTYHFRLRAHRTEFMPRVAFIYPEDAMAKWEQLKQQEQTAYQRQILPGTGENLDDLDFDYTIDGSSAWTPVRVYNDGVKTTIQMPATLSQAEAPILLVVRKDGGLFTDEESVQVNYRQKGNSYIVDSIFEKAILVAGVGSSQDRVTIKKGK